MQVKDIMSAEVQTTSPEDTFEHVATLLHDNAISSVVVVAGAGIAGIVTERDLVNLVADGKDPRATKVADRMTTNVDTVGSRTDIAEAAEHMARLRIRHLPGRGRRRARRHHLDPGPHELGRRRAHGRPRAARPRAEPHGAVRGRADQPGGVGPPGDPAARSNGRRGCSSDPSWARSRGKSSATVQSAAIFTRRVIVGIA